MQNLPSSRSVIRHLLRNIHEFLRAFRNKISIQNIRRSFKEIFDQFAPDQLCISFLNSGILA
jgi:hypothetical protein